jgi:hypothetical protein
MHARRQHHNHDLIKRGSHHGCLDINKQQQQVRGFLSEHHDCCDRRQRFADDRGYRDHRHRCDSRAISAFYTSFNKQERHSGGV